MTDETTTEQLAEIDGQTEDTPATEYTPPEGWRVVRFGELLLPGDVWVNWEGTEARPDILHGDGATASGGRYIRKIKQEPQPEAQPEPQQYTAPEGWRVLAVGEVLRDGDMWVWPTNDQLRQTVHVGAVVGANQRYIRPIEPEPQPEPQPHAAAIEELRSEVSYVQRLLSESRQRVTQLEELVTSLRTINTAQEKTVRLAGQENTDLKHRLNVVSEQWAEQSETVRKLRIELDAREQVPQVIADRFEEGWNQGTARAVETIIAWLEPIRLADSAYLANATMQHLPSIMRHLTGLAQD